MCSVRHNINRHSHHLLIPLLHSPQPIIHRHHHPLLHPFSSSSSSSLKHRLPQQPGIKFRHLPTPTSSNRVIVFSIQACCITSIKYQVNRHTAYSMAPIHRQIIQVHHSGILFCRPKQCRLKHPPVRGRRQLRTRCYRQHIYRVLIR